MRGGGHVSMVTPSASHADRRAWCGRSDKDKRSACWFVARTSLVRRALTLIEVVETRRTGRSARKRSVAPKLERPPYSRGGVVDPWAGGMGVALEGEIPSEMKSGLSALISAIAMRMLPSRRPSLVVCAMSLFVGRLDQVLDVRDGAMPDLPRFSVESAVFAVSRSGPRCAQCGILLEPDGSALWGVLSRSPKVQATRRRWCQGIVPAWPEQQLPSAMRHVLLSGS